MAVQLGSCSWRQRILITKTFVAETILPKLVPRLTARDDVFALAITGSYARNDFAKGSDLDFWVIGPDNTREDMSQQGLDISLLFTSQDYARSLDCAMRFELAQVQILYDPFGLMQTIVSHAKDQAGLIKKEIMHSASQVFHDLAFIFTKTRDTKLKIATLRETARRAAALFVYRARDCRVPKWRHFTKIMFTKDLILLEQISCFDDVNQKKLAKIFSQALKTKNYSLPDKKQIKTYLQHKRSEDAIINLRKALPPLPRISTNDLQGPLLLLFDAAHAFEPESGPSQQALLNTTLRQTRQIMLNLGIENTLSGSRAMFTLLDAKNQKV